VVISHCVHCARAARGRKLSITAVANGNKSLAVTSDSQDDLTDDVSECQVDEVLPLVGERPITAVIGRRLIAVGDLWSYVADKKLSTTDSLRDEYDVRSFSLILIAVANPGFM